MRLYDYGIFQEGGLADGFTGKSVIEKGKPRGTVLLGAAFPEDEFFDGIVECMQS